MKKLTDCYSSLRNGAIHGFAGYGAAVANDANPILAVQIGVIYGIAVSLIFSTVEYFAPKSTETYVKISNKNLASLGLESILIIVCRSFNLVGNLGFLMLGAISLARFYVIRREYVDLLPKSLTSTTILN